MNVHEARTFIGKDCDVVWRDRFGKEQIVRTHIYKLGFIPLYGSYIMGDVDDVFLSKVTRIRPLD